MPESGKIDVFLEEGEESLKDYGENFKEGGKKAMIRIHNQGAIPSDIRDRFFNKYTTSGKRKGTGLGAYSAKLIAHTQQGEIRMVTSEEEGTSIIIYLNRPDVVTNHEVV